MKGYAQSVRGHLSLNNTVEDSEKYRVEWRTHMERTENKGMPKKALLYVEMLGGLQKVRSVSCETRHRPWRPLS